MPLTLVLPLMSWHLLGNAFLFAIPEKRCHMDRIVPDSCSNQLSLPNGMGNYSVGENDDLLRYLFIVKTDDAKYGNCNYRKFPTFNASKFESVCSDLQRLIIFFNRKLNYNIRIIGITVSPKRRCTRRQKTGRLISILKFSTILELLQSSTVLMKNGLKTMKISSNATRGSTTILLALLA